MRYRVEQEPSRDAYGNYVYRIYSGSELIARYWHDYLGDEHGIELTRGGSLSCPGRMIDFLAGGGREPTALSEQAAAYIHEQLHRSTPKPLSNG